MPIKASVLMIVLIGIGVVLFAGCNKGSSESATTTSGVLTVHLVSAEYSPLRSDLFVEGLDPDIGKMLIGDYLLLHLSIENATNDRKADYVGWSDNGHLAILTDELGNTYKQIGMLRRMDGQVGSASIYPGSSVDDVLVFQPLVSAATSGLLVLPCENVGATGQFKLEFGAATIKPLPKAPTNQ